MALHRFMGMDIGVPGPEEFAACYAEIGLVGEGASSGPKEPPLELAFPGDLEVIGKGREAEGR